MYKNIISLIPLSYKSSQEQIENFFIQVKSFIKKVELIVILENDDEISYHYWKRQIEKNGIDNYLLYKLFNKSSKGECLNRAIKECNSEYIMRCDMDDYILPNRYELTLKAIEDKKCKKDFIYSDMIDLNNNKKIKYPSTTNIEFFSLFKNPFPSPTTCFRKSFFVERNLKFPKTNRCEDLYLSLSFIDKKANFFKLDQPVVKYNNNNNFKRDYIHWFTNAKVRFQVRRLRKDSIGYLSLIFIIFILVIANIKLILSFIKKLKIKLYL